MADKKKQHYVPKFLLRNFSNNGAKTKIGLYNVNTDFFKPTIPLESQAQENYFYGNDGAIEDFLGEIEGKVSSIIKQIHVKQSIPKKKTVPYTWLLMFTVDQIFRTKGYVEDLSRQVDETAKELIKFDPDSDHLDLENLTFKAENPAGLALSSVTEKFFLMSDLALKLIVNKTNTKFILSDDPIVKYNQFLEKKNHPSHHTSMLVKGLQLFFPISDTMMIMYYDKWAYDLTVNHDVIFLTNSYDVDKLNALQLINCHNCVYFGEGITRTYLSTLLSKYKDVRNSPPPTDKKETLVYNRKMYMQIYPVGGNKGIKLNLSFIKLDKKANKYIISGSMAPFRNEELRYGAFKKIPVPEPIAKRMIEKYPPTVVE